MKNRYWLHIILFIITFASCTMSGVFWGGVGNYLDITNLHLGLQYATLILGFLTAHEFGHYFAAKIHKVNTSLPFYIPIPPIPPIPLSFGTMGAVIKIREPIPSRKALFDIGVAGPLAGFVVCVSYLIFGLMNLPSIEFLHHIHPESIKSGLKLEGLYFGDNLLYTYLTKIFSNPKGFLPPMSEIYHYPLLNVGWFGLFVTSLNLLPIGQLDGGHITFAMFGKHYHRIIARIVWYALLVIGCIALIALLSDIITPADNEFSFFGKLQNGLYYYLMLAKTNFTLLKYSWIGWLFWALFTKFIIKLDHPDVYDETPIGATRFSIGILAIIIFIISFSLNGIYIVE